MSDALINTAKTVNVKVKDDGTVKVLDFGLAKAFQPDASGPNIFGSPKVHVGHFASLTLGGGSSMLVSQSMITPMSADAEWRQSLRIRPPAFRLENHACAP